MDDTQPLPDMRTGFLDEDSLAALFRDVRELAVVDEIIVKAGPGRVDDSQRITLEEAHRLLTAGEVRGVQLRYRHQGACWWDTLMHSPEGVRLVRVRHDFG